VTTADATALYCRELVAGLADAGVTHVFVSPGSRNTPLTLAALAEPRIVDISIRDERSAGFIAVGLAKATDRPAAVVCTSGSAATHYFPAIVEADQSTVPLVVLTSDRPANLRGTGAPQTMDQMDLFGSHVKRFVDADTGLDGRSLGHAVVIEATGPPAGPVHVNVPLDEPLLPTGPIPQVAAMSIRTPSPSYEGRTDVLDDLGRNVLIVASGRQRPRFGRALETTASALGAPIIADPQVAVPGPNVVEYGDLLVGATAEGLVPVLDDLRPDGVLRLGPLPTSKPVWMWLERSRVPQIHVECSRLADPLGSARTTITADPTAFLEAQRVTRTPDTTYLGRWKTLDQTAARSVADAMSRLAWPNEPEVARSTLAAATRGSIVYLASSRPIRDVDAFAPSRSDITPIANRGVNGIDGTISSAIGAALSGIPTILLIGDVAALHDATALSEAARLSVPLRIIVVNNDGGGIFSFLPQAHSDLVTPEAFERHWGTPHGLRLRDIAEAMGLPVVDVDDAAGLRMAVRAPNESPQLIEIVTDRAANVAHHATVTIAVAAALGRGDEVE
jgi:2-succinyl-5-enolpyruvyl-6-hydroxy-3-cyclohexene-1-carboxylate synthase